MLTTKKHKPTTGLNQNSYRRGLSKPALSHPIQPKLTAGQPNDKYEREADTIADQVIQNDHSPHTPTGISPGNKSVQRMCSECNHEVQMQREPSQQEADQDVMYGWGTEIRQSGVWSMCIDPGNRSDPRTRCSGKKRYRFTYGVADQFEECPNGNKGGSERHRYFRNLRPDEDPYPLCDDFFVQAKCESCKETEDNEKMIQPKGESVAGSAPSSLASQLSASKGKGNPLPNSTRGFMESRIGASFGKVRIHTDRNAIQMNRDLNAQAFTHGKDIYFNRGKYNPESSTGKHLLAHELTHVVQQGKRDKNIQRKVMWSSRDLSSSPFGNHHFILIVPDHPNDIKLPREVKLINFGKDPKNKKDVIGFTFATFKPPELKYNEGDDVNSVKEFVTGNTSFWSDLDYQGNQVLPPNSLGDSDFINELIRLAENYRKNYGKKPFDYSLLDKNCATFVSNLFKASGVSDKKRLKHGEFSGIDWGEEDSMNLNYFQKLMYVNKDKTWIVKDPSRYEQTIISKLPFKTLVNVLTKDNPKNTHKKSQWLKVKVIKQKIIGWVMQNLLREPTKSEYGSLLK